MRKPTPARGDEPADGLDSSSTRTCVSRARGWTGTRMRSSAKRVLHRRFAGVLAVVIGAAMVGNASAETWRGLTIALEHRCSPNERKRDYP